MNKEQLVSKIVEKSGLKKAEAQKALAAFQESVIDALKGGEKVQLIGFGTFSVRDRAARTARSPRTGETVNVPASKQPAFKAGAKLRAELNPAPKAEEKPAKKTKAKKATAKAETKAEEKPAKKPRAKKAKAE